MTPTLTVIITPHGGEPVSSECLSAVRKSAGDDAQVIVLDDSCSPNVASLAETFGAQVVQVGKVRRTSIARNTGARSAEGEILLFLNADVVLADDAVPLILQTFEHDNCDAVVGNYEKPPVSAPLFSQYQDFFTCWHHVQTPADDGRIDWFWTPIGAVRRERFREVGGFRENSKAEDTEFGFSLTARGGKIIMRPDITGRHQHGRTLWSYIGSVFRETIGLTEIHLRENRDLRFRTPFGGWRNIVTLPMSYFMFATLIIGTLVPALWWFNAVSAGAALIHSFVINRQLYRFLTQGRPLFFRGLLFGAFVFYNHVVTNLIVGIAIAFGALRYFLMRRPAVSTPRT
jgi:cellulose synthase/poly-beta-1,6-N-acetylglucosamine synthase-like glycosyltransferase